MKIKKKQKITLTIKELQTIKDNATKKAVKITHLFPLWVLRTKHGFGEKRLRKFMEEYSDLLDSYNKGYVSLPDIAKQLEEEVNIKLK